MEIGYRQTRTSLPSIGDFQRAQDEFEMKKLAALQDQELGKVQIQTLPRIRTRFAFAAMQQAILL